ncbi:MAG: alcohol dehydrogenase class IV [Gammaproteobacteria bacterium]|jgi:alcohol dehydrogenase class IV
MLLITLFNAKSIADKSSQMCEAMNICDKNFSRFYKAICEVLDTVQIPLTLTDIGVPVDYAAAIAEKAIQDSAAGTNPRIATVAEYQTIIERALT